MTSATSFQWKALVVQSVFSNAPKLWPLTKRGEKTTWMQTNSEKLYHEINLAIDSVETAVLLLAKPGTTTAAALQDSMSSIFALAMVGQPYDLTKVRGQDPGSWDLNFTEEALAATEQKGFGVGHSPTGVGMNVAHTSVHTKR